METLTLDEAALLLKIHPVTLSRKARQGQIPGTRIGKCWVFIRVDLIDHIRGQYAVQAMQGEPMEKKTSCHSSNEKIRPIGGSKLQQLTDDAYNKALGLPIR